MKIVYTDVLVIGGGLAGLRLAIGVKRRGHDAIILSLVPPKRSHSAAAQGGMQASLGNVDQGRRATTRTCISRTPSVAATGAPTSRSCACSSTRHPRRCASLPHGACRGAACARATARSSSTARRSPSPSATKRTAWSLQRDFGGTKKWRTCYVSDGTGPRHAVRDERPGDRAAAIPVHERTEALALIHDGSPLLRRSRPQPRHRRTRRLRRQGDRDCERRRGPSLSRDDQRRHLRGYRHRARAGDRRRRRSATWRPCSFIRPASFRRAFWSPKVAVATAACCATPRATASCPTTSRRRRSSRRATWCRGAWRSTSGKGKGVEVALRRAPLARHHAARRASTSTATCAKSRRSATISSASTR